MTYYKTQTLNCQGIPTVEYRIEPDIPTQLSLNFIPTYPYDDYAYSEPKFVFCQQVILAKQWKHCQKYQLTFKDECQVYRICAMELVELSLTGKDLYEPPHWQYGIRGTQGTRELTWFSEDDLISLHEIESKDKF
ncbi:MAG: hypothetical protein AAGF26_15975 [Cyanobacteria bacterium P01_G01_bin.49]